MFSIRIRGLKTAFKRIRKEVDRYWICGFSDVRFLRSFLGLDKIDSVYQSTSDTKVIQLRLLVNRVNALFFVYGNYLGKGRLTANKMRVLRSKVLEQVQKKIKAG